MTSSSKRTSKRKRRKHHKGLHLLMALSLPSRRINTCGLFWYGKSKRQSTLQSICWT
ncbi:unnamed protein product [Haemonchus placei]|uniref:Uncharacterized protein n=1 Tax=Haemonchus placei TaxID=6290 RepID=A0A0N4W5Y5_HAEPC|nr:unnamed protein product [Haemonchus placei]